MLPDDNRDIDPSQPLSLEDALLLATRLHRITQFDAAEELYQAVLQSAPEHPLALQFLGMLEHQRDNTELALGYMGRALAQAPDTPEMQQNYGNMLFELRRFEEAASAYERCAALGGKSAELLSNIGVLQRHLQRYEAAEATYREALKLDPDCVVAYHGYGRLLAQQGRNKEALLQYSEAVTRDPSHAGSRQCLGRVLCILGRFDEAAKLYRDWLVEEPGNPSALHYLAACTGQEVPTRASDAYVASTFDDFAQSFDTKLEALGYRAPALVGEAVNQLLGEPRPERDILDAGCGTGLCGAILKPFARRLVGVDLSVRMLDRARNRGDYDTLYRVELTAFIEDQPQAFDLIVSADTLCYFGDLTAVSQAAYGSLRAQGHLVFTVEALQPGDASGPLRPQAGFALETSGRYSHDRDYVRATLTEAGFRNLELRDVVLRSEAAEPVHGYLVTAQRPAS
jgi:predicted TPR repeat methyltransferase